MNCIKVPWILIIDMRFLSTLLFVSVLTLQGLTQPIDSLERILARTSLSTSERIEHLNLLARELTFVNPIRSIEVSKQALELSSQSGNEKGKAYAYRNLAGAYSYYGSFYLTIDNMQKALETFERPHDSTGCANFK